MFLLKFFNLLALNFPQRHSEKYWQKKDTQRKKKKASDTRWKENMNSEWLQILFKIKHKLRVMGALSVCMLFMCLFLVLITYQLRLILIERNLALKNT